MLNPNELPVASGLPFYPQRSPEEAVRKRAVLVGFGLLAAVAGTLWWADAQWEAGTQDLRSRLENQRLALEPQTVEDRELASLPAPVQRYLRRVLPAGQRLVAAVQFRHQGTFLTGDGTGQWKPFTSEQQVVTQHPGFDWDARISMMPGVTVRVHDAYVGGEGILQASLFGLFPVASLHGTGELAQGELMRYLAEAAWYPTALLPSQGVRWTAVDDHTADGTLVTDGHAVTLRFAFNEEGLIAAVKAEARGRAVGGKFVPTPWQGTFWGYQERSGVIVPTQGEVAWLLPEGAQPYWRGTLTEIVYEFAR